MGLMMRRAMKHTATLALLFFLPCAVGPFQARAAEPAAPPVEANSQAFRTAPDFFPVVAWDRQDAWRKFDPSAEASLREAADCGFNVVGFIRPEDLAVCEKLGLSAIVAPSGAAAGK